MPDGILILDKPAGMSSAFAVKRIKWMLPRGTKVGHAGTLDPFATGILLILIGKATKRCEELMGQPKRYLATIKLGATTDTLDPTAPEIPGPPAPAPAPSPAPALQPPPAPSAAEIAAVLPRFIGTIQQVPPAYSALKRDGQPAYKLARAGKSPELQPRPVTLYSIDLLRYDHPSLELDILCGRGTYIRSLARDIAASLATVGYLTQLRRTAIGPYTIDASVPLSSVTPETVAGLIRC